MAKETIYCKNCGKATTHNNKSTMHLLHFIGTLIFIPWVVVWVICAMNKPYECVECKTVTKL